MFKLLSIFALVAIVRSKTAYDYFDANAQAAAERILGFSTTLNQLLSLEQYKPSTEVVKALQQYKLAAEKVKGSNSAVNENKFDNSFQQLLKDCVAVAASQENKDALTKRISEAISEVQVIDRSLKMNAILLPSPDNSASLGQVTKAKEQGKLKTVLDKTNSLIQQLVHTTKSAMDSCVKAESKKLRDKMIDAIKSIANTFVTKIGNTRLYKE